MKLFLSGLIGGIILFLWSNISWMVLPWHGATLQGFSNEKIVVSALLESSSNSGVYVLPDLRKGKGDCCKYKGPSALIVWNRDGGKNMNSKMLLAFLGNILNALLAAWLLSISNIVSFNKRMLFITALGVFSALAVTLPNMIWWGFSNEFTTVCVADLIIGSALAGAAISKIMEEKKA